MVQVIRDTILSASAGSLAYFAFQEAGSATWVIVVAATRISMMRLFGLRRAISSVNWQANRAMLCSRAS